MNSIPVHKNAHISSLKESGERPMPKHIVSDKLELRSITEFSVREIYTVFNTATEESFSYCGWNHMEQPEDAEDFLRDRARGWKRDSKFSYGVVYDNELVGVTYAQFDKSASADVVVFGLWLHNDVWGRGISGIRADMMLSICFNILAVDRVWVGCLEMNEASQKAIEKYVKRYNGTFYGAPFVKSSSYSEMRRKNVPHHEYTVLEHQFESGDTGIDVTIPGIEYEDIQFD